MDDDDDEDKMGSDGMRREMINVPLIGFKSLKSSMCVCSFVQSSRP